MPIQLSGTNKNSWSEHPLDAKDLKDIVLNFFGKETCDYIYFVASSDFHEFKTLIEKIGFPTHMSNLIPSRHYDGNLVLNAIINIRYPFLIQSNAITNYFKILDDNKTRTELDETYEEEKRDCLERIMEYSGLQSIPYGWLVGFGLDMLEDYRIVLAGKNNEHMSCLESYYIEQIKEKYGSLRWYDAGIHNEKVSDYVSYLNWAYEELSERVCIDCGSMINVYFDDGGYVLPLCVNCRTKSENIEIPSRSRIASFAKNLGYDSFFVPDNLSLTIAKFLMEENELAHNSCGVSLSETTIIQHSKEGKEEIHVFDELKKEYPHLNIYDISDRLDVISKQNEKENIDIKSIKEMIDSEKNRKDGIF